jgi:hypothetical protein
MLDWKHWLNVGVLQATFPSGKSHSKQSFLLSVILPHGAMCGNSPAPELRFTFAENKDKWDSSRMRDGFG